MERLLSLAFILFSLFCTAWGQSMDPKVNITQTDPPSDGHLVRGHIATDVVLNCYVENLDLDVYDVRWQKIWTDDTGKQHIMPISQDMLIYDNMKHSIEKPTAYTWRLRIKALELHDEALYECYIELTGNNNRAMSNRTVLAYDPPLILEGFSSNDMSPQEGDFVPLRCNASGRPYPTIMWRREGNAILPGGGTRSMGPVLDIQNIPWDARGRYICESFNVVGYDRRDVMVNVQHAPKAFPDEAEVGQAVGYQRTLICHIHSNPSPSIEFEDNQLLWIKGAQRVMPSDRIIQTAMEGAFGRLTMEMIFARVEKDDYADYRCQAKTNLGTDETIVKLYETDEPQEDKRGQISGVTLPLFSMATTLMCLLVMLLHTH